MQEVTWCPPLRPPSPLNLFTPIQSPPVLGKKNDVSPLPSCFIWNRRGRSVKKANLAHFGKFWGLLVFLTCPDWSR